MASFYTVVLVHIWGISAFHFSTDIPPRVDLCGHIFHQVNAAFDVNAPEYVARYHEHRYDAPIDNGKLVKLTAEEAKTYTMDKIPKIIHQVSEGVNVFPYN